MGEGLGFTALREELSQNNPRDILLKLETSQLA